MTAARWIAAFLALTVLAASASAVQLARGDFEVKSLAVVGDVMGTAAQPHILTLPTAKDVSRVELAAKSATLVRTYVNSTAGDVAGTTLQVYEPPTKSGFREEFQFNDASVRLLGIASPRDSTLFVSPAPNKASRVAFETTSSSLASVEGQLINTHNMKVQAGERTFYSLYYPIDFPHINATFTEGRVTVSGDFNVFLYGVTYTISGREGAREFTTGKIRTDDLGKVWRTHDENATLVLRGATLSFDVREGVPLNVIAKKMQIDLVGTASATGARGTFEDGTGSYTAQPGKAFALDGTGSFELSPTPEAPDVLSMRLAGGLASEGLTPASRDVNAAGRGTSTIVPATGLALAAGLGGFLLVGIAGTVITIQARRSGGFAALRGRVKPRSGRLARADPSVNHAEEGVFAMERGDYAEAIEHLDLALAKDARNVMLLIDRGFCKERSGDAEGARRDFERAVLEAPGNAEAHFYYSRALAAVGLSAAALTHLNKALAINAGLSEMARRDRGFQNLRDHPTFVGLVG